MSRNPQHCYFYFIFLAVLDSTNKYLKHFTSQNRSKHWRICGIGNRICGIQNSLFNLFFTKWSPAISISITTLISYQLKYQTFDLNSCRPNFDPNSCQTCPISTQYPTTISIPLSPNLISIPVKHPFSISTHNFDLNSCQPNFDLNTQLRSQFLSTQLRSQFLSNIPIFDLERPNFDLSSCQPNFNLNSCQTYPTSIPTFPNVRWLCFPTPNKKLNELTQSSGDRY